VVLREQHGIGQTDITRADNSDLHEGLLTEKIDDGPMLERATWPFRSAGDHRGVSPVTHTTPALVRHGG
jgi:hypothetical protein